MLLPPATTNHHKSPTSPSSPQQRQPHALLRQRLKNRQQLLIIRRAQPRDGIPAGHGGKPSRAAPLVPAAGDIVEGAGIGVDGGVDEADGALAGVGALLVDQRDDAAEGRARGRGPVDELQRAVDGDDVVGAVGGDVGEGADGA